MNSKIQTAPVRSTILSLEYTIRSGGVTVVFWKTIGFVGAGWIVASTFRRIALLLNLVVTSAPVMKLMNLDVGVIINAGRILMTAMSFRIEEPR